LVLHGSQPGHKTSYFLTIAIIASGELRVKGFRAVFRAALIGSGGSGTPGLDGRLTGV
jgi:hypothetical protein